MVMTPIVKLITMLITIAMMLSRIKGTKMIRRTKKRKAKKYKSKRSSCMKMTTSTATIITKLSQRNMYFNCEVKRLCFLVENV